MCKCEHKHNTSSTLYGEHKNMTYLTPSYTMNRLNFMNCIRMLNRARLHTRVVQFIHLLSATLRRCQCARCGPLYRPSEAQTPPPPPPYQFQQRSSSHRVSITRWFRVQESLLRWEPLTHIEEQYSDYTIFSLPRQASS